jgi:tripartite-type tricarboxylate transporter receptor subunit TctC
MFATSSIVSFAKEGKLRILATSLGRRSPLLPDVPTLKESGVEWADFGGGWLGIYGPPRLPAAIAEKLNNAFSVAFASPEVQPRLNMGGLVYTPYRTPEQLAKFTRDQRDMYRTTVKAVGLPMVD